jgi:integrase
MYLLVHPNGSKYFRLDYRFAGKRKTLALGVYPEISLKDAREKMYAVKKQINDGIDPGESRKQAKAEQALILEREQRIAEGIPLQDSFEEVARDWMENKYRHEVAAPTHNKTKARLEQYVFPAIGQLPIAELKPLHILPILKDAAAIGHVDTAHRIRNACSRIFKYAIIHGKCENDATAALDKSIPPIKITHRAAITDPVKVGQLLRDIYNYQGTFVVERAFRLTPLVFLRPGEVRQAEWKDIDLDARLWRPFITKTNVEHIVPLSDQALAILKEMKPLTGHGRYVFPSARNDGRPMSNGTIRLALRTLGYEKDEMSAHGFRTTASTLLNEQGWPPDAIERQLSHMPRDAVRAAYNRAQYLDERRRIMQAWADYLDSLKNGADVIPLRKQS